MIRFTATQRQRITATAATFSNLFVEHMVLRRCSAFFWISVVCTQQLELRRSKRADINYKSTSARVRLTLVNVPHRNGAAPECGSPNGAAFCATLAPRESAGLDPVIHRIAVAHGELVLVAVHSLHSVPRRGVWLSTNALYRCITIARGSVPTPQVKRSRAFPSKLTAGSPRGGDSALPRGWLIDVAEKRRPSEPSE